MKEVIERILDANPSLTRRGFDDPDGHYFDAWFPITDDDAADFEACVRWLRQCPRERGSNLWNDGHTSRLTGHVIVGRTIDQGIILAGALHLGIATKRDGDGAYLGINCDKLPAKLADETNETGDF